MSHTPTIDREATQTALLALIGQLATELRGTAPSALTLDSRLEQDAGIDSLGRMELGLRIEKTFGHALADTDLLSAVSPRDLLESLLRSGMQAPAPVKAAMAAAPAAAPSDVDLPQQAQTLVEVLDWYATHSPERIHVHLYGEDETISPITYADLQASAERVAAGLRARGLEPGERVALMLPTGRDFFDGFYGILIAGGVPVPIYPPMRMAQIEEHLRRQIGILANAQARLLISVEAARGLAPLLKANLPDLFDIVTAADLRVPSGMTSRLPADGTQLAFLQYTSGSTGQPKGVALTHANLLANVRAMGRAAQVTRDDVFVSWLPLYHDMGLIGACLGTLYHGFPLVLMSPLAFIARPARWLQALHRHRGTLSAAPNFAYELAARKINDADIADIDLSCWRMACNGAEPVSPDTLERFASRFAAHGLRREAIMPVYGLAECSVGLAFPPIGRGPRIDVIDRDSFLEQRRAVPAQDRADNVLRMVGCGIPLPGHELRIVDETSRELGERRVGKLQFRGPSATSGYFRNPEATRGLLVDGWLDSGDYAYVADGEVFITGRSKDLIIRAGRNIYPYDLEAAIGHLPGIRQGGVAVFDAPPVRDGETERLVVLAETRARKDGHHAELREQIRALSQELVASAPDDIVLAPPRTVLKTSSGKIRRADCRALYVQGRLGRSLPVWLQFARLAGTGLPALLQRGLRKTGAWLYSSYAWFMFGLACTLVIPLLAILPVRGLRRRIARLGLHALRFVTATPLQVSGALPTHDGAQVIVANHASYADALVMLATLPADFDFVAKRELMDNRAVRWLLNIIGTQFVERFDAERSMQHVGELAAVLKSGRSLFVFPEGTFTRASGLLPFKLGGFVVAAEAGVPVIPVALRGTRSLLRSDQWFVRRHALHVSIGEPIRPAGNTWEDVLALRDASRAFILPHSGEPDLGGL